MFRHIFSPFRFDGARVRNLLRNVGRLLVDARAIDRVAAPELVPELVAAEPERELVPVG